MLARGNGTAPTTPRQNGNTVRFSPSTGQSQSTSLSSSVVGYRIEVPPDSPLTQPLSLSSSGATMGGRSLIGRSSDEESSLAEDSPGIGVNHNAITPRHDNYSRAGGTNGAALNSETAASFSNTPFDQIFSNSIATASEAVLSTKRRRKQGGYQEFSDKGMLPPMIPRREVLFYPRRSRASEDPNGVPGPFCDGNSDTDSVGSAVSARNRVPLKRRPPDYLQLYVKCERSEPFHSEDLDIMTWYRDGDNRVTADRTLVVRGTANIVDLVRGIVESFGLSTPAAAPDDDDVGGPGSPIVGDKYFNKKSPSLDCYNGVCFVSDIKTTTCTETAETHLTPMPIPGMQYKYVERCAKRDKEGDDNARGKSSLLSADPEGLRRTLVAQLLDRPVHQGTSPTSRHAKGLRSRLALVYCTRKRQAYVSSRSTHRGTLPETIYHFQILLEGIVAEDDLPSSFASQTAVRCVGATGGVLGGSIMDKQDEINDLNRVLWDLCENGWGGESGGGGGGGGPSRDVVGLVTPRASRSDNLEQILYTLAVPLFDYEGNQTPKEFVVDRVLYNIYSGKLSMEVARRTQKAVEAVEGASERLTRRMEDFTKRLANNVTACEEKVVAEVFENNESMDQFDLAISKLGITSVGGSGTNWI